MGSATHTSDATGLGPIVLGIESSCDETAVALVRADRTIIAQAIASQEAEHAPYGGVVPEIAARAHAERVAPMIEAVMGQAGLTLDDVDAIAATAGPGLIGGVMVGLVSAKALAMASGKPLLAINHLEGHALSPRLADEGLAFPYLLLLVSGGHCQILAVDGVGQYRRLATTIDDALGEAFDKTAKLLGLGYPGGPAVERMARDGDPKAVPLPRPLKGSSEPHFSFAGLKSAVLRAKEQQEKSVRAEPVEALLFLRERRWKTRTARRQAQGEREKNRSLDSLLKFAGQPLDILFRGGFGHRHQQRVIERRNPAIQPPQ